MILSHIEDVTFARKIARNVGHTVLWSATPGEHSDILVPLPLTIKTMLQLTHHAQKNVQA